MKQQITKIDGSVLECDYFYLSSGLRYPLYTFKRHSDGVVCITDGKKEWVPKEDIRGWDDLDNTYDIHTITAAGVYSIHPSQVTREQRAEGKSHNFGFLYSDYLIQTLEENGFRND